MALKVQPFCGVRFDEKRFSIGETLCPPYDVIGPELAAKLRRGARNAIHLELPKAHAAARVLWNRWRAAGVLVQDERPAYYVVEQVFAWRGRRRARTGLLTALGLDGGTARRVLRHERTLPKPRGERARLLKTVKVNTSPIFGVYADPGGRLKRLLAGAKRARPLAAGRDHQGIAYRLWRVDEPALVRGIETAFRARSLLIADGHHRYESARLHWGAAREPGSDHVLAYLVAEEDPGLIVNPTHRVVRPSPELERALSVRCRGRRVGSLAALERALAREPSPYAFGLANGRLQLMRPAGGGGVPSRFGTDWLARRVLGSVDPQAIAYFHEASAAAASAKAGGAWAFFVRPFSVKDIRLAVARAGLLPQKSTYFYPKIATGLVFRSFG